NTELINVCIDLLIDKLILFDLEISLLESIRTEEHEAEPVEEKLSREELGRKRKFDIVVAQKYSKLQQKMGDIRRGGSEFFKQRNAMKKRYYKELITFLEINSLKEVGSEYYRLAESIAKRRDFRTSSLMLLMHGITLIKTNESLQKIRSNIRKYLDSLGLNKKLVEDTYYVLCLDFILDVKSHSLNNYLTKIKDLLEILPLFEEEKQLIEIDF
ncbi:MAG: hypothetical protein ACXABG_05205, partial [Promethearchaeota archaeon]